MILYWITFLVALIGSNADGEFSILHTPKSLTFVRTSETWESQLKEIFSAALGLTVEYNTEWKGMYVMDPFATPEAVVEVHIDGVPSLIEQQSGLTTTIFPLTADKNEPYTFKGMQSRIEQHFTEGRNKIVNVKLYSDQREVIIRRAFGSSNGTANNTTQHKIKHLNPAVEEDKLFLKELQTLESVIEKVSSGNIIPDNLIDFYYLRFRTLHLLSDFYGPISIQTKEAKYLLGEAVEALSTAFVKAYDGSVLVAVVTTDVAHTRRTARSVTNPPGHSKRWPYQEKEPPIDWQKLPQKPKKKTGRRQVENTIPESGQSVTQTTPLSVAPTSEGADVKMAGTDEISQHSVLRDSLPKHPEYKHKDPGAPYVIFNLFLWFGVVFGAVVLAIVYALMDMDPGRDTIIYRLTTMRMKKEM